MTRWVPFTAHVKIVPARGSGELKTKRFETWRDMQKISVLMYEGLEDEVLLNIASPGGGQQTSNGGSGGSGMSGMAAGMAVKPQLGETPAQTMITGFFNSSAANSQPHPEKMVISSGEIWEGPGATPWLQNPASATDTDAAACKAALESGIVAGLPVGIEYEIFRLDYSGVIYGDRGYHFP